MPVVSRGVSVSLEVEIDTFVPWFHWQIDQRFSGLVEEEAPYYNHDAIACDQWGFLGFILGPRTCEILLPSSYIRPKALMTRSWGVPRGGIMDCTKIFEKSWWIKQEPPCFPRIIGVCQIYMLKRSWKTIPKSTQKRLYGWWMLCHVWVIVFISCVYCINLYFLVWNHKSWRTHMFSPPTVFGLESAKKISNSCGSLISDRSICCLIM